MWGRSINARQDDKEGKGRGKSKSQCQPSSVQGYRISLCLHYTSSIAPSLFLSSTVRDAGPTVTTTPQTITAAPDRTVDLRGTSRPSASLFLDLHHCRTTGVRAGGKDWRSQATSISVRRSCMLWLARLAGHGLYNIIQPTTIRRGVETTRVKVARPPLSLSRSSAAASLSCNSAFPQQSSITTISSTTRQTRTCLLSRRQPRQFGTFLVLRRTAP